MKVNLRRKSPESQGGALDSRSALTRGRAERKPSDSPVSVCRNKRSTVTLGAHSRSAKEEEKQIIPVKKEFPYPCYDKDTHEGDLQLVQVRTLLVRPPG